MTVQFSLARTSTSNTRGVLLENFLHDMSYRSTSAPNLVLEDPDKYKLFFAEHFFDKHHLNYVGITAGKEYVVITMSDAAVEETTRVFYRAIIRTSKVRKSRSPLTTPQSDTVVEIERCNEKLQPAKTSSKVLIKELQGAVSYLSKAKLLLVSDVQLSKDLLAFERKHVCDSKCQNLHQQTVTGVKIGVVHCKEGQTTEEEMFSNSM